MTLTLTFEIGPQTLQFLTQLLEDNMSQLSDSIAAVKVAAQAAIQRVQSDVDALNAKIQALQATALSGGGTPEQMQDLADAKAMLDALDPTKPDVIPPDQPPAPS